MILLDVGDLVRQIATETALFGVQIPAHFELKINVFRDFFVPSGASSFSLLVIMATDTQVFVGAIEYNLDKETLEDEVYKWDGVASVYYKGPTSGWANVSFVSREKRDKFLADKSKHRSVQRDDASILRIPQ